MTWRAAMQAQRDYRIKLKLLEGEQILYIIGHHTISEVASLIFPVSMLLTVLSLYGYLALGGGFTMARDSLAVGQLERIDWLLLVLVGVLALTWLLLGSVERQGYRKTRWGLVGMLVTVLLVLVYRLSGGRLFAPDPFGAQPFSPPGILLLLLAMGFAAQAIYIFVDLINDQFILTNRRVIYFNGAVLIPYLIEKQVQRDVTLEDIQNVASRTETYLQHWLSYGTIKVETATFGAPLIFRAAHDAREMQRRIMSERQRLLQQQTERNFDQLVATRVYKDEGERPPWSYPYRIFTFPRPLGWMLDENPRIDPAQRSLTWYPHWIFLVRDLSWPLGTLVISVSLLVLLTSVAWINPLLLLAIGGLISLICILWAVYEFEDYRNDRYMLTPTILVDIEKKPFGPEGRRSASLGNIQTVTLRTTFISNVFGYGDVVMTTAGTGGEFTFFRVPRPREVAATINQAIAVYRKGDRDRGLEDALNLLREFHEAQRRTGELKT